MPLPIRMAYRSGKSGLCRVEVTVAGLAVQGQTPPRLDLLLALWEALVSAIALDEIDFRPTVKPSVAERVAGEARAALQVRLGAKAPKRREHV